MSKIIPSTDLEDKYSEVSEFCNTYDEPVYVTKNGFGDLVVMNIKQFEAITAKIELYENIMKGVKSIEEGKVLPFEDAFVIINKQ